jgi:signal transduction histidine kinase
MQNRFRILLAVLLLGLLPVRLSAQHNPYKIDDSLYAYFQQMVKLKTDSVCLKMADTLYARAFALGDAKAQCLAYTIPVNYYFTQHHDFESIHRAANTLRKVARRAGYLRYYYFATSNEVTYLLNEGKSAQAIRLAHRMRNEAFTDNNPHGMYSCLLALGNVYYMRHEYTKSLEFYNQAYEQLTQHLPEQDDTQVLSRISSCYAEMNDSSNALKYARQALSTPKTESGLLRALEQDLGYFYRFGQIKEFLHYYEVGKDLMTRVGYKYRDGWYQVEAYKSMHDGRYSQAREYADLAGGDYERAFLYSQIYVAEGDYRKAWEWAMKAGEANEDRFLIQQNEDLDEMEAQERREQLAEQMRALEEEHRHVEATRHKIRVRLFLISVGLIVVILTVLLAARHRHVRELTVKNKALEAARKAVDEALITAEQARRAAEEARDKAELADQMKTMFVQNMSHEIRTPLNAIVGFSSILTDPSFDLPAEERKDLGTQIAKNSDLLTTLINDILDLSNLESGKYNMDLQPVGANQIASNALETVMCRKPADVDMHFDSDVPDDFMLTTDGMRVQQVLINFLTNAEKNTEHGQISLHCSAQARPGFVTYSVEDTGIGVPPEKAHAIFERFAKLDQFKQGTGLGLSICTAISDRLGGHVYLDTQYTHGARFVFEVPA